MIDDFSDGEGDQETDREDQGVKQEGDVVIQQEVEEQSQPEGEERQDEKEAGDRSKETFGL